MFKKGFIMSILLLTILVLTGCGSSNVYTYIIDDSYTEYITLGTSADYPPYEWPTRVDGKETLVGIDIEIAKAIAKAEGKNLKVINKGFDFLLEDLKNGKVDFVLAGMTPTAERAEQVDFSMVYYEAIQVVLVKTTNVETYNSFDALNQSTVRVSAQLGSIQQELAETFTNAQKQYIQAVPDLVMRLIDGQVDAVIMEKPVADGYIKNQTGLNIAPITIGDPDGGSAVAVKKGDQALLDSINAVITDLINSGKMDEIVNEMILLNAN